MGRSYVGAIDNGTTSSRFLIFDDEGKLVIGHQLEYRQIYPKSGWVEQDPFDILDSVINCLDQATKKFELQGHKLRHLKGIGITNQRETTVVWDRETGQPLYNAIVWSDVRTQQVVDELIIQGGKDGADVLKEMCGLPLTTYFSAVKLVWMLKNVDAVQKAHQDGRLMFGTVDTWIIYNLTGGPKHDGVHVTDVTNASRTMLMDIHTLDWSEECLKFFGIKREILGTIKPSSTLFGHLKIAGSVLASERLFPELDGLPIAGCLGDQHAALVGQHCFESGEAKNTYGTGCFMVFNTGDKVVPSNNGLLTTVGYQFEGHAASYALEGSIAVAGSAIKWLRDNMGIIRHTEEINDLARGVTDNGGVVFVTAFSGLFAPYWKPQVRGTILGLSQHTTKHHLARATLEATCFQTRAILDAMNRDSGKPLKTLRVDGGMSNSDVCMQMQADILGLDVKRPMMRESTALGAATAAGVALNIGIWQGGFEEFKKRVKENEKESETAEGGGDGEVKVGGLQTFSPHISEEQRDEQYGLWQKAIEKSLSWC